MAARDGGSWRDEIYGFQPIPRAKWKSVYEVLFGRPLSRPPIGRHLFLLIGRGLRRAPGGGGCHRKYDGRMRRWDLSGVGTNEDTENLSLFGLVNHRGCEAATQDPPRRRSTRSYSMRIDIPGCANKRNPGGGCSTFFSLFFFLSFRPCISRDSKIPLEFLPFPRLIGQFIWLSWSGVN